ncbi:PRKR-interacting protein 1-like protein [Smittium culicis]|uniref:PRKR-interacting protein 1-like protein n=1 Tax=Smittium culicis TaxID=133412 RepID=A0A1R1X3N8_9FUNG|nr:PRKR-interacting protein 1-like protein [Smittium culicis]
MEPEIKLGGDAAEPVEDVKVVRKKRGQMTAVEKQRADLDKLLRDPSKPANAEMLLEKKRGYSAADALAPPPEFVKTYMGSSAGAGSGEFHVYRHLRRKELMRQAVLKEEVIKDARQRELEEKRARIEALSEERTAKRRNKRLKRKTGKINKELGVEKQAVDKDAGHKFAMRACQDDEEEDGDEKRAELRGGELGPILANDKNESGDSSKSRLEDAGVDISAIERSAHRAVDPSNFTKIIDDEL